MVRWSCLANLMWNANFWRSSIPSSCHFIPTFASALLMSARSIPCIVPGCPHHFKSQGRCTYHVRTYHENHNVVTLPIPAPIPDTLLVPAPIPNQFLEPELPNNPLGSASPSPAHRRSQSPLNTHTELLGAQRIFHPHLTGMCLSLHSMTILWFVQLKAFHAMKMGIPSHQELHPNLVQLQLTMTGLPM